MYSFVGATTEEKKKAKTEREINATLTTFFRRQTKVSFIVGLGLHHTHHALCLKRLRGRGGGWEWNELGTPSKAEFKATGEAWEVILTYSRLVCLLLPVHWRHFCNFIFKEKNLSTLVMTAGHCCPEDRRKSTHTHTHTHTHTTHTHTKSS